MTWLFSLISNLVAFASLTVSGTTIFSPRMTLILWQSAVPSAFASVWSNAAAWLTGSCFSKSEATKRKKFDRLFSCILFIYLFFFYLHFLHQPSIWIEHFRCAKQRQELQRLHLVLRLWKPKFPLHFSFSRNRLDRQLIPYEYNQIGWDNGNPQVESKTNDL